MCLIRTSLGANDVLVVKSAVSQRFSALSFLSFSQSMGSVCALHCTSYDAPVYSFFASFSFLLVLKSFPLSTTRWRQSPSFPFAPETKAKYSTT